VRAIHAMGCQEGRCCCCCLAEEGEEGHELVVQQWGWVVTEKVKGVGKTCSLVVVVCCLLLLLCFMCMML